ncbi:tetratricopeptide repeat protein 28-like [Oculina patagonica]
MAAHYSVDKQLSADPYLLALVGIEIDVMKKERNCSCLYISYYGEEVFLWILKASGFDFRNLKVNNIVDVASARNLDEFIAASSLVFGIFTDEDCEDRSLNDIEPKTKSSPGELERPAALQEIKDDDKETLLSASILSLYSKMIISPVVDLLVEPEIIIVPDPSLYKVPFAALRDKSGKYLSETYRIRIVPSLMTLKLIQDSPADYHNQTGALIVGDPDVGKVLFKGRRITFLPLPCARKEAEMIGQLLGVEPLLGQCATKQAVLERLHSVSLIHFAAHGNAERGEIALAPVCTATAVPGEEDYLLTMSDISQVQLRAKLVVLSCCHSGRGQIRAEGVVGIARAFLGSGARSVLVALWALDDIATEQFMRRFYEHLVRGESASESLHEAMKWMRGNGFTEVSEWAPFMLIGDNVTFDFGK